MVADLCHLCFRPAIPQSEKSITNKLKWRSAERKNTLISGGAGRDFRNKTAGRDAKTNKRVFAQRPCHFNSCQLSTFRLAGSQDERTIISVGSRRSFDYLTSLSASAN
jgi:hypothetical protein